MNKRATIGGQSIGVTRVIKIWLIQHAQAFVFSLGQMSKNPMGSFLTIAVIGISLSLPAGFYLLLDNAQRITASWSGAAQITLFLKLETDDQHVHRLSEKLQQHVDIDTIVIIDRHQALTEFKQISGFGEALAALDTNPLPAVLLLQPTSNVISSGRGEQLIKSLHDMPEVDIAQFDRQWAKRLFTIIEVFQRAVFMLSTLLAVAVLLIVGNTIRLAIYSRHTEIEINKLFGATNSFIQRPFLYSGLIHGFCGSIMAWFLLVVSLLLLEAPIMRLTGLYYSNFRLAGLSGNESLILIGSGALLGLAGSWLAVQRHLKVIEPV